MDSWETATTEEAVTAVPLESPEELVRRLFLGEYARMVRVARYLSGQPDRGEEIAQEAFAVLLRRAGTLEDPEGAAAYLRRVVANLSASAHRRRRVASRLAGRVAAPGIATGEGEAEVESRQVVLAALSRLPKRQRECLVLRYYLDLSEADIALSLGISAGSVKVHSSRGLAALSRMLGGRP